MTHVMTKTTKADGVWQKGAISALSQTGGGKIVVAPKRGVEVWANDPARFLKFVDLILGTK